MTDSARKHQIAVIAGAGIGIEVTASTLDVPARAKYKTKGLFTPEGWLDHLRPFDAIFFGAVGDPDVPDHISLWELILPRRQVFQQYVNARPSSILPGSPARVVGAQPADLDWVIIRENTEGEYAGQGGESI